MCNGPHKRTTLTTGGKRDRQNRNRTENRSFSCKNLPKPTDSKILETVTTLLVAQHNRPVHYLCCMKRQYNLTFYNYIMFIENVN